MLVVDPNRRSESAWLWVALLRFSLFSMAGGRSESVDLGALLWEIAVVDAKTTW